MSSESRRAGALLDGAPLEEAGDLRTTTGRRAGAEPWTRRATAATLWCCLGVLLWACGSDELPGGGPVHPLSVWNQSQYDLLEVRVHASESFDGAENLAGLGLRRGEHLRLDDFQSGSYVTVIRRRVDVGARLAISTAVPLELDGDGYTLVVFDTSFRLLEPDHADNLF